MSREPRVVAELGRPETPQETADRKAESSRVYRSSQTARNLIAALIATLIIVGVVIFGVPRGTPPEAEPIDVAAVAADVAAAEGRALIVPDAPADWRVNRAYIDRDDLSAWTVVYAPEVGFVRIAQGFDADPAWTTRVLGGADVDGTMTVDGIEWSVYAIDDPDRAGGITAAISTQVGDDTVLIYGVADDDLMAQAAASVSSSIDELRQESQ
ncbi:DUF4245 family protein [Microbacterium sp. C7(2022)]|uniref:DUF4245 family protein n=1 Tax=Microbacterium sp. C7(2022) TaxID=2992759 RepID=UPI00237A6D8A|nr:DUF4245 family protein [Microbacterium sp. C7(2022)]MDE0545764.1 DUF4245 domain-containing protein [Microbacterium sp. C7(2022)]